MDSPWHCAHHCTYTMTDNDTKKIVGMQTLDKRETENEKYQFIKKCGFERVLQDTRSNRNVLEAVTDAHLQIGDSMSKT